MREFDEAHPEVELRFDESISSELIERLTAGDLVLEPLMDDPLHLAVPHDHPLATARRVRMADRKDEVWIEGRDPVCSQPLRRAANAAGFEPKICLESAQWLGKQGLVAAGAGITLIPTLALAHVRLRLRAPAVEPMRETLRRVAAEHCFSCDARLR